MGLGRIQNYLKQSWESPFVRTLWPVQPELRPQARIFRTLSVQGFLNHYFAALFHSCAWETIPDWSQPSWCCELTNTLNTAEKGKSDLSLCLHGFVPHKAILDTGSQRCTRKRTFKTTCCSGTPCKTRNSWVVFYRTELHLWVVKIQYCFLVWNRDFLFVFEDNSYLCFHSMPADSLWMNPHFPRCQAWWSTCSGCFSILTAGNPISLTQIKLVQNDLKYFHIT